MADSEVETAKVTRVGVFSLAGTFALVSLFSSIIFSVVIAIILPGVLNAFHFQLPFNLSFSYFVLYVLGSAIVTFISFLVLGLFYNLSALATKGIKLYSS